MIVTVLLLTVLLVFNIAQAQKKNIIVMISDGWGYNQIESTTDWRGSAASYTSWEVVYPMSTYSLGDDYTGTLAWIDFNYVKSRYTDSAAAATAMSTGYKTNDGKIGVDPGNAVVEHVLERAESIGMATGVITSVQISHATPAGHVAHNSSRNNYVAIAEEMVNQSGADVIMGAGHPAYNDDGALSSGSYQYVGGETVWDGLVTGTAGGDADGDGVDDPWTLIQTKEEFQNLSTGDAPDRVIGIAQTKSTLQEKRSGKPGGNSTESPYTVAMNTNVPTLVDMTKAALNVLDNDPDGLFLMIEGGAVDWANHDNVLGRMIEEQIDYDNAVAAVEEWVETNSNWEETLVIVTGDHETGYLLGPDSGPPATWNPIIDNGVSTMPGFRYYSGSHTNSLIPLYAKGLGSDGFASYATNTDPVRGDFIDNTNIAHLIFSLLGGTAVEPEDAPSAQPSTFDVGDAYPNPFNPTVTVPFSLTHDGMVTIEMYDILGRSVFQMNQHFSAGQQSVSLNLDGQQHHMTSGSYILRLRHEDTQDTQKITFLK